MYNVLSRPAWVIMHKSIIVRISSGGIPIVWLNCSTIASLGDYNKVYLLHAAEPERLIIRVASLKGAGNTYTANVLMVPA